MVSVMDDGDWLIAADYGDYQQRMMCICIEQQVL